LIEKGFERDTVEERPLRIACNTAGRREQMFQACLGSSCDKEDSKRGGTLIAVQIVQSQLSLKAFDVFVRLDAFGTVIELHEELEALAVAGEDLERRVGIERLAIDIEPQGFVGVVVGELDPGTPGSDVGVNYEVGEKARVRLRGMGNRSEKGSWRERGIAVEQAETGASQLVVEMGSLAGRGVGPRTHPAGRAKHLESFTKIPFAGERRGETLTDLEQLPFVVGPAGEDRKQLPVAIGEQDVLGASWHVRRARVA
jgi:hypothetical protein